MRKVAVLAALAIACAADGANPASEVSPTRLTVMSGEEVVLDATELLGYAPKQ